MGWHASEVPVVSAAPRHVRSWHPGKFDVIVPLLCFSLARWLTLALAPTLCRHLPRLQRLVPARSRWMLATRARQQQRSQRSRCHGPPACTMNTDTADELMIHQQDGAASAGRPARDCHSSEPREWRSPVTVQKLCSARPRFGVACNALLQEVVELGRELAAFTCNHPRNRRVYWLHVNVDTHCHFCFCCRTHAVAAECRLPSGS